MRRESLDKVGKLVNGVKRQVLAIAKGEADQEDANIIEGIGSSLAELAIKAWRKAGRVPAPRRKP